MRDCELRQLTPIEAWQITCHEAGHAVLGVRFQIPFWDVERGAGEHGEVKYAVGPIEKPNGNYSEDEISRWQLFLAGGAAAELLLFDTYRPYAVSKDRRDHDLLEKRRGTRRGGWYQDIQSAMNFLDRESIEKVAKVLDQQKKLSDEQVYELLGRTPFWHLDLAKEVTGS